MVMSSHVTGKVMLGLAITYVEKNGEDGLPVKGRECHKDLAAERLPLLRPGRTALWFCHGCTGLLVKYLTTISANGVWSEQLKCSLNSAVMFQGSYSYYGK